MTPKRGASLKSLAETYEIEIEFLELAVHEGAVRPEELTEETHAAAALSRLRRLQRLCASLELDVYAGSIIIDLLERLESAHRELERHRRGLEG